MTEGPRRAAAIARPDAVVDVPCPLCGGDGEVLVSHRTSVTSEATVLPQPSTLALCTQCGHLHTALPGLALDAYYRETYDATLADDGFDELVTLRDGTTRPRTDVDAEHALAALAGLDPQTARVLEVGAGNGRVCARLARLHGYAQVYAQDVGARYAAPLAARLGTDRVSIGPLPDGPFDAVLSVFALEHDAAPATTLRAIHARLREGGRLFVAVPNPATNVGDLACADHTHHYTRQRLVALLADVGFAPQHVDDGSALGSLYVTATKRSEAPAALEPSDALSVARAVVEPYRQLAARLERLADEIGDGPTYLYGAGFYASLVRGHLARPIAGLFDSNPRKQGQRRLGTTVQAPPASDARCDGAVVLCMSPQAAAPLLPTLRRQFARVVSW